MVTMVMTQAGVAQLKARLSEYLAHVRAGAEVVVTDRGRPVAKLVPVDSGELGELERRGIARAGPMKLPAGFLEEQRTRVEGQDVTDALVEERRTGR